MRDDYGNVFIEPVKLKELLEKITAKGEYVVTVNRVGNLAILRKSDLEYSGYVELRDETVVFI